MTKEKVIQTLIDDYSKQAKLSKRERTIFEHGLLTGIEIGPIEKPEVDLEKTLIGFQNRYVHENSGELPSAIEIAKHFFELGLAQKG